MFSTICSFEFQVGHLTGIEPLVVKTRRTSQTIHFQHGFCRPLHFKQNPPSKIISFGLSPDSAHSLATEVQLPSTENPDSVLALFHEYGFTQAQIAHIVSKRPGVLAMDPETTLKPKLDFFRGFGVSGSELGDVIAMNPTILARSLENDIRPSFGVLKKYVDSNEDIIRAYKTRKSLLRHGSAKALEDNVALLLEIGLPRGYISSIVVKYPKPLLMSQDKFKEVVGRIKEMGCTPSSPMFVQAIKATGSLTKESLDKKLLLFRSFGWSDEEVFALFRKQPSVLAYSDKKLVESLKYFMEERKWTREAIIMSPWVLGVSMEKRIIPRYAVLDTLMSHGVKMSPSRAMVVSEANFLERYVNKYRGILPELMKVYKCGTGMETELAGL